MARPLPKSGLVYFPFDIISGKGIQQIEADFGLKGFAVMMKLLQSVYSQGYYMPWNSNRAELFSAQLRISRNLVSKIIAAALKQKVFHQDFYEKFGILTSKEIQENYFDAAKRRKSVKINEKYLLVNPALFLDECRIEWENGCNFPANVNFSCEKNQNFAQSKGKESREDPYNTNIESKGEKNKEDFYNQGNVLQPPELEEVREYARQNGLSCNPDAFYRYYQAHDWMDKKRNAIWNWQRALVAWDKRERLYVRRQIATGPGSSIDKKALDEYIDGQFT